MKNTEKLSLVLLLIFTTITLFSQKKSKSSESTDLLNSSVFSEFKFRSIGPSFMSGRIADIAIHPENQNTWYVAVGSGGVWKTTNSGITWQAIFDSQPVYSIGCITIDPSDNHKIWVGTGENVGGRHVGIGDGIYLSEDDGTTWTNMGLKKSEHISKIIVNPKNSNIIYVAAQGPLWKNGGERGFYLSKDDGKTWEKTLGDNEWTGVTDIVIDKRNPEIVYAATWQRHRNVASYMGGGPNSGIYKSNDGGKTWKKLKTGLPKGNIGKIGLAISPQNPDVIYAAIELDRRKGGIYKSNNKGESWVKQSETVSGGTGPHYYQELYASPHVFDKIYLADYTMKVSEDGGKIFRNMKEKYKHGDNHALVFKPNDPDYLLCGTDGGLYESFDSENNWRFIANLPVTQFYKVALDDTKPFYNIIGGTQDNSTQSGPSRTDKVNGISHFDWEIVLGGDGHQPATEPGNPDIIYAESQEGYLNRIDRKTGETVFIQPQPKEGEGFERFNWDSPILISPHSASTIYYASHRVWKSENRGDKWEVISGDLTKNQDRFLLPIMGKKQSWDSPWDVYAMSTYNTITSISESPKKEGLIYIGTDDGLIQMTEDGGKIWTKIPVSKLPGVPVTAFVNDIKADLHDQNTVFIALDNHKFGDFKPYLYKSINKGKTWQSLTATLPENLMIWRIVQDHVNKDLLFIGTEYGIYFSINGGKKWVKFTGGLPTISFRDLAIQKDYNDLVAASFGRGFYILDDYSPLRNITEKDLNKEAILFNPNDSWWYIERRPLGGRGKGYQGEAFFTAENPPYGTVFSYYLKSDVQSIQEKRKEKEKTLIKQNADIPFPGWDKLDDEKNQVKATIWLTVIDKEGKTVRKIEGPAKKGFHRVNWNLRMASFRPVNPENVNLKQKSSGRSNGFLVTPGTFKVFLSIENSGVVKVLSDTLEFEIKPLYEPTLKGANYNELASFWKKLSDIQSDILIFYNELNKSIKKVNAITLANKRALQSDNKLTKDIHDTYHRLLDIKKEIYGSPSKNEVGEKTKPTISSRFATSIWTNGNNTYGPTENMSDNLEIALKEYQIIKEKFKTIKESDIPKLLNDLKKAEAPVIE